MGKIFIVIGAALLGYGIYTELNPPKKETAEQKAARDAVADKKQADDKAAAEKQELQKLAAIEAQNIASGLNADGTKKATG